MKEKGVESYKALLRAYSHLYAQASLLVVLREPYGKPRIELVLAAYKTSILLSYSLYYLLISPSQFLPLLIVLLCSHHSLPSLLGGLSLEHART